MNIFLLSQRSTKIQLDMHLTNEQEVELENRYDFKVYFSDDGKHCKGVLNTEVRHKADPGAFYLFIEKAVQIGIILWIN